MPEEYEEEEKYESVYDDQGREALTENDEISPEEEAFMQGYDEAGEVEESTKGEKEYDEAFEDEKKKKRSR